MAGLLYKSSYLEGQTRRDFVRSLGGITFAFTLGGIACSGNGDTGPATPISESASEIDLNAYVNVAPDGTVTILAPSAEMGQGTLTALPLIVAEEMDVDWDDVRILPSPPAGEAFGDPFFLNMIFSTASRAAVVYFDRLRRYGAQARAILLTNAATKMGVPAGELTADRSRVIHHASNQFMTYGELAAFAELPDQMPSLDEVVLKSPDQFKLIGTSVPRRDSPGKVNGQAQFSIDVTLPGMLYATVLRAPILGAQLVSLDKGEVDNRQGIQILTNDNTVAVVAESFHEALKARERLRVSWSQVESASSYSSDAALKKNILAARDFDTSGFPWDASGDTKNAFASADNIFEREYQTDYQYHAQMEPLNAVVWVQDDGTRAEVWAGTQGPLATQEAVARTIGIDIGQITLHRTYLGGAFGRRSLESMDFVTDAAWLSQQLQKPIKVIWTREDDIAQGHFRPMTAQFLRVSLSADSSVTGWHHRVACDDPLAKFDPRLYQAWGNIPLIAMLGSEHQSPERTPLPYAYDLPNRLVEHVPVPTGVRIYAMRGVGAMPNCFAIESFLDELAADLGQNPLELRKSLLHRSPRAQQVLATVAEMSDWEADRQGRAVGLAYSHYSGSPMACAAEVSVDQERGVLVVHGIWVAADVGLAIQPDIVRAQIEGAVIFGLGNALYERIDIENGLPQQDNFDQYHLARISQTPRIQVELMSSKEPPSGAGEAGTVVTPPAIANAFASLTGRRLRHLPFTSDRIKGALV